MPASPGLSRAARGEWRWFAAVALAVCAALAALNGLGRIDATLYDAAISMSAHAAPADVVIVAIDEASLSTLGRWPWPRRIHARLLERIAAGHPKAVGLDMVFSEADADDALLAEALKRVPAVLPALIETRVTDGMRQLKTTLPAAPLLQASTAIGHIHLDPDFDGLARSVFLREGLHLPPPDTRTWPHFALAMRQTGDPGWKDAPWPGQRNPRPAVAGRWSRDFELRIPYLGPPGTFDRVSYADVLEGRVPPGRFEGRYVFVGATAAGLGDAYATPVTGHARLMPGVEINANVLETLRRGSAIVEAGALANVLFNIVPLAIVLAALLRLSPRRALALSLAMLALLPLMAWLLLRQGMWFAPAAGMLCVAAAYPLWSWRRLEATVRYLGEEFQRMSAEPRVLPDEAPLPGHGSDVVETRMLAVAAAADRLRQARRFVSDIIEGLPDGALVVDTHALVVVANRAAATMFGANSSDELRGRPIAELLGMLAPSRGDQATPGWEALRELAGSPGASDDGTAHSLECVTRTERSLLVRATHLRGLDGGVAGWIVGLSDISELREAERAREEVLAFLSHDMRSPQSSIIALLELHELDPDDNPKEEVHKRIEQYARRTLSLSEQFLQLARAESKAHEPVIEDLGGIADEAVEDVWAAASQKSMRLDLRWDGEPVPVLADRPLLLRAVINLLTNAVKYSPENTTVTVTVGARELDGELHHVCEVADRGYGISPENQARLFERYRRFSEPGQPKAQGAGLGMAFVKTVVEKHRGRILVRSTPGEGSTFTIVLPPVADEEARAPAAL